MLPTADPGPSDDAAPSDHAGPSDHAAQPAGPHPQRAVAAGGRAALQALLERLGIATVTTEHDPVFTVAEADALGATMPGVSCKTLLLQEAGSGDLILLLMRGGVRLDINRLRAATGCRRLSFASAETLWQTLRLTPGSVTPFGLINATPPQPRQMLIDAALLGAPLVSVHPLTNTASTAIAPRDLVALCRHLGWPPQAVDLEAGATQPLPF